MILTGTGTPALAASDSKLVAEKNNGVGICMSRVAVQAELIGVDRLGQEARDRFSDVGDLMVCATPVEDRLGQATWARAQLVDRGGSAADSPVHVGDRLQ